LRNSFRPGTYTGSSKTAETLGAYLVERSPLREEDHLHEVETIETAKMTASLRETTLLAGITLLGRLKEEGTEISIQ